MIKKSREQESLSQEIVLRACKPSPRALLKMPRKQAWKSEAQLDFPTSTWESVAEEPLAVRVPKLGTTSRWPSSRDTLIWNALLPRSRKWLTLPSPAGSKSMWSSELKLDNAIIIWTILGWIHTLILVELNPLLRRVYSGAFFYYELFFNIFYLLLIWSIYKY